MPPPDPAAESGAVAEGGIVAEGARIMTICNACRYCEGFCPVFPAMERRRVFLEADMNYLANLCHNCGECFHACPYTPPHAFEVNVPRTLAEIRARSYGRYAWPRALGRAFENNGTLMASILALSLLLAVASGAATGRMLAPAGAVFYDVMPHGVMVGVFGTAFAAAAAILAVGLVRCVRESGPNAAQLARPAVLWKAARDALSLRHLDSGGRGCASPDERPSPARRLWHHCTFYGCLLCFASTVVAAVYHYGGSTAPYDYLSLPVVLGTLGGVGLLIGPAGLYRLRRRRDPAVGDPAQDGMDQAFLAMLFLTSATGLMLLVFRETRAMAPLLWVHLGVVLALFLALPYGKFVHGVYRFAALLRYGLESESDASTRSAPRLGGAGPPLVAQSRRNRADSRETSRGPDQGEDHVRRKDREGQ